MDLIRYDLTSVKQVPALTKWVANKMENGVNFDIGAGKYELAGDYLKDRGFEYYPFDPHCLPDDINHDTLTKALTMKTEKKVVITLSNVLCVIPSKMLRDNLLRLVSSMAKPGYEVYFSIYEGDKSGIGKRTSRNTWQENRKTKTYIKQIEPFFDTVKHQEKNIIYAENSLTF